LFGTRKTDDRPREEKFVPRKENYKGKESKKERKLGNGIANPESRITRN